MRIVTSKEGIREYFDKTANRRTVWKERNSFYHKSLERYFSLIIPTGSRVLELGCGTGDLLAAVKPGYGVGVDFSPVTISIARTRYPDIHFREGDIEDSLWADDPSFKEVKFDYIILSDILHILWDVQKALNQLHQFCHPWTRIIISNYNFLWEPWLKLGEYTGMKQKSPNSNWLSHRDIFKLLEIEGFEMISHYRKLLIPKYIFLLNSLMNRFLINLPLVNIMGLVNFVIARPLPIRKEEYTVSIIIPARNEMGNIQNAILMTPVFGRSQEFIFVEGHSSDGTWEEMERVKKTLDGKNIKILKQSGKGKGNAVREGFNAASGEILMILDADLTTPPEELPKFYSALAEGRGEFINGCRLVYPMEKEAMRFLNLIANKFFGWFFSYLLGQRLKDTLCGTKVLFKSDYEKIKTNRSYFGDFDPFGDFDLLFGAAKLNLKITEVLVRYKERTYGSTQISRFRHGWLLLKMSMFAAGKIKFI